MLFHLIIFAFFAFVKSDKYEDFRSDSLESLRLPNNTKPILYDIHLFTDENLALNNYSGIVTITIEILKDTNEIVFHADKIIEITKVTLIDQENGVEYENINYTRNPSYDFLIISSNSKTLEKGKLLILSIAFKNLYRTKYDSSQLKGFYTVNNKDAATKDKWTSVAMTFFEPVYARIAFPCYDEPMFKAKFSISITHGANLTALSNMPVDGKPIEAENGMVTTKFQRSPPMSSYTVAFVIGNFTSSFAQVNNTLLNVYTLPTDSEKQAFTLDVASKALTILENYFEIPYKLPKLDHIYLPGLQNDAMENWGLIIHRDMYNYKNEFSSPPNVLRLYNAIVIVHETIHQWFGNLVTPKWWNQVWLNEGMTYFYTVKIIEMLYPDWGSLEYKVIEECDRAWSVSEDRPMSEYVEDESDLWHTLGAIYNCKADKFLRMFEHAITPKTFKKGVIKYLNKFQLSNAEENDLFDCLQEAATEDHIPEFKKPDIVKKMMSSWTQQKDFPIVSVTRNYTEGTFQLTQKPINIDGFNYKQGVYDKWWIPITFTTASDLNFENITTDFIFPNQEELIVDPLKYKKPLSMDDWMLLNKNQIGVYVVEYDERNWNLIIDALKKDPKVISVWSKVQLIRDANILNLYSSLPADTLNKLVSYLEYEDEILPWIEGIKVIRDIYRQRLRRKQEETFSNLVKILSHIPKDFDNVNANSPIKEIFEENVKYFRCC